LTFFDKATLLTEKVIDLGKVEGKVMSLDCNWGYAAVVMEDRVVLVRNEEKIEQMGGSG
jgi:hypothetical protein